MLSEVESAVQTVGAMFILQKEFESPTNFQQCKIDYERNKQRERTITVCIADPMC